MSVKASSLISGFTSHKLLPAEHVFNFCGPMQFCYVIFLVTIATLANATPAKSTKGFKGWYSCSEYTFSADGSSSGEDTECAVYNALLCHPGVCDTPEGIDPTIEVFVKRLPATEVNPETARNVWLLQGGPGISSVPLESTMASLHAQLEGAVNVYLMDHRGTGRSTRLDCLAANITASIWGREVEPSAVGACAQELVSKYGDLSSFSTTSAATDVASFVAEHTNGQDTIAFGWSYGTALAERLMHLNPPEITGYVLDGIASSSGSAPAESFEYYSTWDTDFGEVADRFLALCEQDEQISARFKQRGVSGTIQNLITKLDRDPGSECAMLINGFQIANGVTSTEPPSFSLRRALGTMLSDAELRKLIPPFVYRLNRCASKDIEVLGQVVGTLKSSLNTTIEDITYQSALLFNLITFSDMWETPAPSMSKMKKRFTDVLISDTGIYTSTELYCAFSKEKSRTCDKFTSGNYDANPIIYERDQYWNKSAVIPSQASVLLLSSKLDGQTPHKYAEYLLGALDGDNKELITFDYATHGTVISTQLATGEIACGMELLVSYVKNGADLEMLDKSCLDKMPEVNLTIPTDYMQGYMLTTDAYDGKYDPYLSSPESDQQ